MAYVDSQSRLVVNSLKKKAKPTFHKLGSSYVKLSVSNSGRYLGVFYPEETSYKILDLHSYDKNASTFNVIDENKAQDIAWFGPKDRDYFCIIGFKTDKTEEKVKVARLIITTKNKNRTIEKQIQDVRVAQIDENGK